MNKTTIQNSTMSTLMPKLDLIAGKDDLRPTMMHIFVSPEEIAVTDSHVLAKVNTKDIFNESSMHKSTEFFELLAEDNLLIHHEDWKKLYAAGVIYFEFINSAKPMIKIHNGKKRPQIIELERESDYGNYPNYNAVIPDVNDTHESSQIGINPELLARLCKALRLETCVLRNGQSANRAINILPNSKQANETIDFRAIIMPVLN